MNYSAFYDDVLVDCPRCPLPVVLAAVRSSVIELCNKSRIWVQTNDPEPAVANVGEYDMNLPDYTEIIEILGGYFNSLPLTYQSNRQLDHRYGDWRSLTGGPLWVTSEIPGRMLVVPYPDVVTTTDSFRWRFSLRPTLASTSFDPDGMFCNDFYQEIIHGAKARLMMSPGKPYSSHKLAEYHLKAWEAGINRARVLANRNRGPSEIYVELPRKP